MGKKKADTPAKKNFRVGNYKVAAYEHLGVPVFEVANLEDTWMVRIPVDFQMYGILNQLFGDFTGNDEAVKSAADEVLGMFFMNWQNVTGIPNGYYHQGLVLLTAAYAQPELLKASFWGKGKQFHRDVKSLRNSFLEWHKAAERLEQEAEKSVDLEKEAYADQSKEILKASEADEKE